MSNKPEASLAMNTDEASLLARALKYYLACTSLEVADEIRAEHDLFLTRFANLQSHLFQVQQHRDQAEKERIALEKKQRKEKIVEAVQNAYQSRGWGRPETGVNVDFYEALIEEIKEAGL